MTPHAKPVGKAELRPQRPQRPHAYFSGLSAIGNCVPNATPLRPRLDERGYGPRSIGDGARERDARFENIGLSDSSTSTIALVSRVSAASRWPFYSATGNYEPGHRVAMRLTARICERLSGGRS
jgi:hypothetical protein